jgi:hypothetical protein
VAQLPLEYELLSPLPADFVTARFEGPYNGRVVTWHLQCYTVKRFFSEFEIPQEFGDVKEPCQFIHVKEENDDLNTIEVALNLAQIDEPALKKVIIMIRNYKRLRPGWHLWGRVS